MNNCILPYEHYNLIYKASYLAIFSFSYACYREQYSMAIVPGGVFVTSINYWRYPIKNCWRRKLDMSYVNFCIFYNIVRAYNAQNQNQYYFVLFMGITCYLLSIYYYNQHKLWTSTYLHCLVHVFGQVSNIILYSGEIRPITQSVF